VDVFFFGRQIQTSAYVRDSLVAAVKLQELQNLMRALQAKRLEGPLDEKKPPPSGFESAARAMWRDDMATASARESSPYIPADATPEEIQHIEEAFDKSREEREKQERTQREPFDKWAAEERERYVALRQEAEQTALKNAKNRVPKTMDISLLGGGWSFLLEFSTVIIIIFILLCLSILNALTGKEAITILASIAGYVLGKASASSQRGQSPEQSAQALPLQGASQVHNP
jgi:hypothetical protein